MQRLLLSSAFSLLVGMLLLSAGQAQDERGQDAGAGDFGDAERGRAIVVAATGGSPGNACFQCHGMDGKGDPAAGFPRLSGQVYQYLYDSLKDYVSGVRQNQIMAPIAKALTDQQMRDAAAYYAKQPQTAFAPQEISDHFLFERGAAVAAIGSAERRVQACINCHGPDGSGLAPTYPYLAGQYSRYIEMQLNAWRSGTRKSDRLSAVVMEGIAKRLSPEEVRAVSLYYASIRPKLAEVEPHESIESLGR